MVYRDMTFCTNKDCPFKDCERHNKHLKGVYGLASVADFSGTCRRYISYVVDDVMKGGEADE